MKKGSLTIEAAFLIPMMFLAFTAMITLTFQVYEKAALPSVTYIALLRGSIEYETSEAKIKDIIKSEYDSLAKNRLLFSSGEDTDIEIDDNKLQIRSDHSKKEIINQLNRKRPIEFIRSCRKLLKLSNQVKSEK